MKNGKTIIICIDRDNDLGEKTRFKGPLIGEMACREAANELLLADPEDTDANSIFGALKVKNELKENAEVVILTGDRDVGVKSDKEISRQLELVIEKIKPKDAIIVTDGAEDEFIIPIIQSRIPISGVKRIVVKQSEQLESSYYVLKDFIRNIASNPRASRIFIGLPSIAIILIALFGSIAWKLIFLAIGGYLFIKGFQLEEFASNLAKNIIKNLMKSKFTLFSFIVALAFFVSGFIFGYNEIKNSLILDPIMLLLVFLKTAIPFFSVSGFFAWLGSLASRKQEEKYYSHLSYLAVIFAISIFSYSAVEFLIEPTKGFGNLLYSIILGFICISLFLLVEKMHAIEKVRTLRSKINRVRLKKFRTRLKKFRKR